MLANQTRSTAVMLIMGYAGIHGRAGRRHPQLAAGRRRRRQGAGRAAAHQRERPPLGSLGRGHVKAAAVLGGC